MTSRWQIAQRFVGYEALERSGEQPKGRETCASDTEILPFWYSQYGNVSSVKCIAVTLERCVPVMKALQCARLYVILRTAFTRKIGRTAQTPGHMCIEYRIIAILAF